MTFKADVEFDEKSLRQIEKQLESLSAGMRLKMTGKAARAGAKVFVQALKAAYRALPIKKSGARELARTVRSRAARRRAGKGGAQNILVGNARGEGFFWNWIERGTAPHRVGKGSTLKKGGQQGGALHPGTRAYSPIRKTIEKTKKEIGEEIAAELQRQIKSQR